MTRHAAARGEQRVDAGREADVGGQHGGAVRDRGGRQRNAGREHRGARHVERDGGAGGLAERDDAGRHLEEHRPARGGAGGRVRERRERRIEELRTDRPAADHQVRPGDPAAGLPGGVDEPHEHHALGGRRGDAEPGGQLVEERLAHGRRAHAVHAGVGDDDRRAERAAVRRRGGREQLERRVLRDLRDRERRAADRHGGRGDDARHRERGPGRQRGAGLEVDHLAGDGERAPERAGVGAATTATIVPAAGGESASGDADEAHDRGDPLAPATRHAALLGWSGPPAALLPRSSYRQPHPGVQHPRRERGGISRVGRTPRDRARWTARSRSGRGARGAGRTRRSRRPRAAGARRP